MFRSGSVILVAAVLTATLGGQAAAQSAVRSSPTNNAVSISSVYARNTQGVKQAIFSPGAQIQYTWIIDNTGPAVKALVQIEAFWNNVDDGGTQLVDTEIQNVNIPAGVAGFYNPEIIPKNAVPGPYIIGVTISYEGSSGIAVTTGTSTAGIPTVTGNDSIAGCTPGALKGGGDLPLSCGCPKEPKASCLTYWDQYAVYAKNSEDCGIASVAMVLNYYDQGPAWKQTWAQGRTAGLEAIRNASGAPGNVTTTPRNLEKAITFFKGSYVPVIPNYAAVDSVTLIGIAAAIRARHPVIAFVDASVLGRGYGGHWLVVRGFTTDSNGNTWVDAYDPDQNPYSSSAYPDGAIAVPLATFSKAITDGLGTDSIVVTG